MSQVASLDVLSEAAMYEQIARYMAFAHPYVLYRFDLAADLKLTLGQAARHKRLHPHRGWPDLFIAALSARGPVSGQPANYGLFLELKREGTRLKTKTGRWASRHIEEQAEVLEQLRQQGYAAEFAVGLEDALRKIDVYLGATGSVDGF